MPTGAKSKLCALRSSVVSLLRIYLSLARVKIFIQNGGRGSFPGGGNDRRSLVEEEENDDSDDSDDEEKTPRVRVPLRRRVRLVFPTVVVVLSPVVVLALLFSLVVCTRKSARRSAYYKSLEETVRKSGRGGRWRPL